ncbi:MAG: glycosyltransferase family 2 protein [Deltaproteobacteria bacterium]|nr:glycosyltransferase family 2 protein [Deltaproteobacteria bacterium]
METLAIIVNYKAAALTIKAVRSILIADSLGSCRVVVVDNSENSREENKLRSSLPEGVKLLVPSENLGFGRACNLALEDFSGDFILLLNPDARLLPGCLSRLQETLLEEEKMAAVGPQVFWDDGCNCYLPPPSTPFIFLFAPAIAELSPRAWMKRAMNRAWRYHAIKIWCSEAPTKSGNLSGGHVLLRRDAVEQSGGLFDPRFFLYFEDTDLFMRLRKAGYFLVFDTRAKVVHHYDQCVRHETELKRQLFIDSHEKFRQKYLIGGKKWLYTLLQWVSGGVGKKPGLKKARFLPLPSGWRFQPRRGRTGFLNGAPHPTLPPLPGCSAGENFWILPLNIGTCWLRAATMVVWAVQGGCLRMFTRYPGR